MMKNRNAGKIVAMASVPARVPDMGKRQLLNLLLLGAISLPTAGALGPYLLFFVPPRYRMSGWSIQYHYLSIICLITGI
jgi:cytochrome b6-f complex iron-sulfur subunit